MRRTASGSGDSGMDIDDVDGADGPGGTADGSEGPGPEGPSIDHAESCRICSGPIQRINTTYCYSNLLVRELATVGIKVEHFFDGGPEGTAGTAGPEGPEGPDIADMASSLMEDLSVC